jgi:hypothetical protein
MKVSEFVANMFTFRRGIPPTTARAIASLAVTLGPVATAQEWPLERPDFEKWLIYDMDVLFTPFLTHSEFMVKVASHGTPVADVTAVFEADPFAPMGVSASPVSRRTNSNAIAEFSAIQPGKYGIRVDELLFESFASVTVDPEATNAEDVKLEWPSISDTVQNVGGTLISAETSVPQASIRVELLDLRTSRVFGATWTDLAGFYEIPFTGEGIYALRFSPFDEFGGHRDLGIE